MSAGVAATAAGGGETIIGYWVEIGKKGEARYAEIALGLGLAVLAVSTSLALAIGFSRAEIDALRDEIAVLRVEVSVMQHRLGVERLDDATRSTGKM